MVIPPRDVYDEGAFWREYNTPVKRPTEYEFNQMMQEASKAGAAATVAAVGETAVGTAVGSAAMIGGTMAAIGTVSTLAQPKINRNGSLTGWQGAMCKKNPFLIIKRNRPFNPSPDGVGNIEGKPANRDATLNQCHGFTVCKEVKLNSSCTEEEEKMIVLALKQGVYL